MKKNGQNREPINQPSQVPYERLSVDQRPIVHRKKKKKKGAGFTVVLVLLVIVGILLAASGVGAIYFNKLMNLIDRTDQTGDMTIDETDLVDPSDLVDETDSAGGIQDAVDSFDEIKDNPVLKNEDIYNILLIGTDTREGDKGGRSDAMIIVSINKKTQKIHLTSLMRAMYVLIPEKGWGMLNASYSWGGPKMLMNTIETNFKIKIDDYMIINFGGFTQAIDEVGGLDIELTAKEADYLNKDLMTSGITEGMNHLDGAASLAYARIRKIDSDFKRTGRQRTVIETLIKKAADMSPVALLGLAEVVLPLTKTNLSKGEMLSLMADMMDARKYPVNQLMLPLEEDREMIYVRKMEMYKFDFAKTIDTLHTFINE